MDQANEILSSLTTEQRTIAARIFMGMANPKGYQHRFVVCGEAGTGKSHLLRILQDSIQVTGLSHLTMSPTALAAKNVRGQTVHSALNIKLKRWADGKTTESFEATDWYKIKAHELIVFEEYYMMRAFLFGMIMNQLGLKCVVLFGDNGQFNPIKGAPLTNEFLEGQPFNFQIYRLLEQRRQCEDPLFLYFLRLVRQGHFEHKFIQLLVACRSVKSDKLIDDIESHEISVVSTNSEKDKINNRVINTMNAKGGKYYIPSVKICDSGQFLNPGAEKDTLLKRLSIPDLLHVVPHRVRYILTKNVDPKQGWVNGTMVSVIKIFDHTGAISIADYKDSSKTYVLSCWEETIYQKVKGNTRDETNAKPAYLISYMPLKEAFAVTAYSLQGFTLDTLFIQLDVKDVNLQDLESSSDNDDDDDYLQDSQFAANKDDIPDPDLILKTKTNRTFYVAASRCKDLLGLLLRKDLVIEDSPEATLKGHFLSDSDFPAQYTRDQILKYANAHRIPAHIRTNDQLKEYTTKLREYRTKSKDYLFEKFSIPI